MLILSGWLLAAIIFAIAVISLQGSLAMTAIPYLATPYKPGDFGLKYEDVRFKTEDGLVLAGWFVPAPKGSDRTIIVHHGLGSNAGDTLLNTVCLAADGRWNLFYYNFRGHDGSEGRYTSLGTLELRDFRAALRFLRSEKTQQARRLAVYGHSLGAAVAISGASEDKGIEAVAAESSFASVITTIRHYGWHYHGLPYFLVWLGFGITWLRLGFWINDFNPVKAIRNIAPRPVFLIQGERDFRIPMADFDALYHAAGEPKECWVVPGADHGDPWRLMPQEYEKRLVDFFRRYF